MLSFLKAFLPTPKVRSLAALQQLLDSEAAFPAQAIVEGDQPKGEGVRQDHAVFHRIARRERQGVEDFRPGCRGVGLWIGRPGRPFSHSRKLTFGFGVAAFVSMPGSTAPVRISL